MSTDTNLIHFNPNELGPIGTTFISEIDTINGGDTLRVTLSSGEQQEVGDLIPTAARNLTGITINENNRLVFEMDEGLHLYDAGELIIRETVNGDFPSGIGALTTSGELKTLTGGYGITLVESSENFTMTVDSFTGDSSFTNVHSTYGTASYTKTHYVSKDSTGEFIDGLEIPLESNLRLEKGRSTITVKVEGKNTSLLSCICKNSATGVVIKMQEFITFTHGHSPFFTFKLVIDVTEPLEVDVSIRTDSETGRIFNFYPGKMQGNMDVPYYDLKVENIIIDSTSLVNYEPPLVGGSAQYNNVNAYLSAGDNDFDFIQILNGEILNGYLFLKRVGDEIIALPKESDYIIHIDVTTLAVTKTKIETGKPLYCGNNKTTVFVAISGRTNYLEYDIATKVFSESDIPLHRSAASCIWNEYKQELCALHSNGGHYPYDSETKTYSGIVYTIEIAEGVVVAPVDWRNGQRSHDVVNIPWVSGYTNLNAFAYLDKCVKVDASIRSVGFSENSLTVVERNNYTNPRVNLKGKGLAYLEGSKLGDAAAPWSGEYVGASYYSNPNTDMANNPEYIEILDITDNLFKAKGIKLIEQNSNASYGPATKVVIKSTIDTMITQDQYSLVSSSGSYYGDTVVNYNVRKLFDPSNSFNATDQFDAWQHNNGAWFVLEFNEPTTINNIGWRNSWDGSRSTEEPVGTILLQQSDDGETWSDVELDASEYQATAENLIILPEAINVLGLRLEPVDKTISNSYGIYQFYPVFDTGNGLEPITREVGLIPNKTQIKLMDGTVVTTSSTHPDISGSSYGPLNLFLDLAERKGAVTPDFANDSTRTITYMFPELKSLKEIILSRQIYSTDIVNTDNNIQYTVNGTDWIDLVMGYDTAYPDNLDFTYPIQPKTTFSRVRDAHNDLPLVQPITTKFLRAQFWTDNNKKVSIGRWYMNRVLPKDYTVIKTVDLPDQTVGNRETEILFDAPVEFNRLRIEAHGVYGTSNKWRVYDAIMLSDDINEYKVETSDLTGTVEETRFVKDESQYLDEAQLATLNGLLLNEMSSQWMVNGDQVEAIYLETSRTFVALKNNEFYKFTTIDSLTTYNHIPGKGMIFVDSISNGIFLIDFELVIKKTDLNFGNFQPYPEFNGTADVHSKGINIGNDIILVPPSKLEIAYLCEPLKDVSRSVNWPSEKNTYLNVNWRRHLTSYVDRATSTTYSPPCDGTLFNVCQLPGTEGLRKKIINPNNLALGYLAIPDSSFLDKNIFTVKEPPILGALTSNHLHPMRSNVMESLNERIIYDISPGHLNQKVELVYDFTENVNLTGLDIQNGNVEYWKFEGIPETGTTIFEEPVTVLGVRFVVPTIDTSGKGLSVALPIFTGQEEPYDHLTTKVETDINSTNVLLSDGTQVSSTSAWSGFLLSNILTGGGNGFGLAWQYNSAVAHNVTFMFPEERELAGVRLISNYPQYTNKTMNMEYTLNGVDWISDSKYNGLESPYVANQSNRIGIYYGPKANTSPSPNTYILYSSDDGVDWQLIKEHQVDEEDVVSYEWLKRIEFPKVSTRFLKLVAVTPGETFTLSRLYPITDEETFTTTDYHRTYSAPIDSSAAPWSDDTVLEKYITVNKLSENEIIAFPYKADYPVIINTETKTTEVYKEGHFATVQNNICHSFIHSDGRVVFIHSDGIAYYMDSERNVERFQITFQPNILGSTLGKDGFRYFLPMNNSNTLLKLNLVNLMNFEELYVGAVNGSNNYNAKILTIEDSMLYIRRYRDLNLTFPIIDLYSRIGSPGPTFPRGQSGFADAVRLSTGDIFLIPYGHTKDLDFFALLKRKDRNDISIPNFEEFMELEG